MTFVLALAAAALVFVGFVLGSMRAYSVAYRQCEIVNASWLLRLVACDGVLSQSAVDGMRVRLAATAETSPNIVRAAEKALAAADG